VLDSGALLLLPLPAQGGLCDVPGIGKVCDAAGAAATGIAGDFFDSVAHKFLEGVGKATELVVTFWVQIPTPVIDQNSGPVAALRGSLSWLVGAMGVIGLLLGLSRVIWSHRGDEASEVFKGLIRLVLATAAAVPVVALLTQAFDEFSVWILNRSAGGDLGAVVLKFASGSALGGLGSAIIFIVGILGIFSALAQVFLLLIRAGMIIILAGVLPLAAAGSTTEAGKATLYKTTAWLLAFVLYKPVAAIIYAAAFFTAGQGGDVGSQLTGLFMIVMAVVALPALMRLLTPAVGAAASGAGGGGAALGLAAATGAVQIASMAGGRSSSNGRGSSASPSGSGHGDGGSTGGGTRPTGGPSPQPTGGPSPQPTGGGAGPGGGGAGSAAAGPAAAGVAVAQSGINAVRRGVGGATGAQEEGTDR
jgi:type IV secretion system protein TrbL